VVTTAVNDLLAPVRARRAEYARDLGYVRQVLRDGNERANEDRGGHPGRGAGGPGHALLGLGRGVEHAAGGGDDAGAAWA